MLPVEADRETPGKALVGADGLVHRELFDVAAGALLWRDGGLAFLLQGAATKATATALAAAVSPSSPAG